VFETHYSGLKFSFRNNPGRASSTMQIMQASRCYSFSIILKHITLKNINIKAQVPRTGDPQGKNATTQAPGFFIYLNEELKADLGIH
jgi:hypothetical protein